MLFKLIVREPFQNYAKGDEITDAQTVAAILASELASHVIKLPADQQTPN